MYGPPAPPEAEAVNVTDFPVATEVTRGVTETTMAFTLTVTVPVSEAPFESVTFTVIGESCVEENEWLT